MFSSSGKIFNVNTGDVREYFYIDKVIGKGSSGITYLVYEVATGKPFACKTISKFGLRGKRIDYVRSEVAVMRHLSDHPNIVKLHYVFEDSQAVHIIMELCNGGDLLDRIEKKGVYSENDAAKLMWSIMGAIQACHSAGVLHRDVKPENILFIDDSNDAKVKLTDFGLSTFFSPGDIFTDGVGTLRYMAPEVLTNQSGPEADMWSAGVTLFIVLTGDFPFHAPTDKRFVDQLKTGNFDFKSNVWETLSESAKDIIRKMFNLDPTKRLTMNGFFRHPWICRHVSCSHEKLDNNNPGGSSAPHFH